MVARLGLPGTTADPHYIPLIDVVDSSAPLHVNALAAAKPRLSEPSPRTSGPKRGGDVRVADPDPQDLSDIDREAGGPQYHHRARRRIDEPQPLQHADPQCQQSEFLNRPGASGDPGLSRVVHKCRGGVCAC